MRAKLLPFVLLAALASSPSPVAAQADDPVAPHRRAEAQRKAAAALRFERESLGKIASPEQLRYDLGYVQLDLTFTPALQTLAGTVTLDARVVDGPLSQCELDLDGALAVSATRVGATNTPHSHLGSKLRVDLDRAYTNGETFTVEVDYAGSPDEAQGAFGFDSYLGQNLIWSLSEPFGARTWWPVKDAPTDKADSASIRFTVPTGMIAVSNGKLESVVPLGATTRYEWKERFPIAPYLVSIAAYPYTEQTLTWNPGDQPSLPVTVWSWPSAAGSALSAANQTRTMLDAFSDYFGPYPFPGEKYGQAQFLWGGGMEHQTATSLCCWSSPGLIAHELAHQWFGDQVTCDSFTEIWVNEGFATYGEALWREYTEGPTGYLDEMEAAAYYGPGTIRVPEADLNDFGRVFSSGLSYNKASWVLHMLRGVMGDADFFAFLQAYVSDPQLSYATARTEDVQRVAEQVSGLDLAAFFHQWIDEPYFPTYGFDWTAVDTGSGWDVSVTVDQLQAHHVYTMPITLRVHTASGTTDHVVQSDEVHEVYALNSAEEPLQIEFDPDHWILHGLEQTIPTPTFHRGVLVVNGVDWNTYGAEITSAYADSAFSGHHPFEFWDLFGAPAGGYGGALPAPLGHGNIPPETLGEFSTVIWVGNNYNGDLDPWNAAAINSFLRSGGNLLLLCRMGQDFLTPLRADYLGVRFAESTYNTVATAVADRPGLVSMSPISTQSLVSVFETTFDQPESELLFRETSSFAVDRGLGVWRHPTGGGTIRPSGGHFAHVAGRPYRWNHSLLRANVHEILTNLFQEPSQPVAVGPGGPLLRNALYAPHPNPFNPRVSVEGQVARAERVQVRIYDARGRFVRTLLDEEMPRGEFARVWDGRDERGRLVASGVYSIRLRTSQGEDRRKVTLLR